MCDVRVHMRENESRTEAISVDSDVLQRPEGTELRPVQRVVDHEVVNLRVGVGELVREWAVRRVIGLVGGWEGGWMVGWIGEKVGG